MINISLTYHIEFVVTSFLSLCLHLHLCLHLSWHCLHWNSNSGSLSNNGSLTSSFDYWLYWSSYLRSNFLLLNWLVRWLWSLSVLLVFMGGSSVLACPSIIDLLILFWKSQRSFPSLDFVLLLDSFSSYSWLSHKSLHLGSFVSSGLSILLALEGSSDGVFLDQSNRTAESFLFLCLLNTIKFSNTTGSLGS